MRLHGVVSVCYQPVNHEIHLNLTHSSSQALQPPEWAEWAEGAQDVLVLEWLYFNGYISVDIYQFIEMYVYR